MSGVIYILTNPSFPEYVKIGYADDIELRDKFVEKVKEELNPKNIYTIQIGACVACHSGPSVFGIGSMKS